MRKQVCQYCGHVHVPTNRGRKSYKKKNPDFFCSQCERRNKPNQRDPKREARQRTCARS